MRKAEAGGAWPVDAKHLVPTTRREQKGGEIDTASHRLAIIQLSDRGGGLFQPEGGNSGVYRVYEDARYPLAPAPPPNHSVNERAARYS